MAITYVDATATASQTDFAFNFPYLEDEHVAVFVDGVKKTIGADQDYTVETSPSKRIVLNVAATGGEVVRVRRISAPETDLVDFQNGSVLTEAELDRAYLHNRYLAEESAEQNDISLRVKAGADGSFDALNKKIVNVVDPTADQDAATKNYVDDTVAGVVGGTIPDGSITNTKLATGAVTSDKISTTDTNFNIQSDGKVGIGIASPDVLLSVNGAIESFKDRQAGTPEGGQFILRSQDPNGYRWNIDNLSFANGTGGSLFRLFKSDEADSENGVSYLTIDPTTGYVNIGSGSTATHALDVVGDVNITGDYKVNGTNLQTVPTGTVSAFAGSAAPTGYALCDGSAVNRTTQAALFAVIGTTYGVGDGSTTFNLPDLRGRVVAGMGGSLLSGTDAVADTGGAKEHTLTIDEIPSHTHAGSTQSGLQSDTGSGRLTNDAGNLTGATGGGQAHNNVQPTIILNYIIKT